MEQPAERARLEAKQRTKSINLGQAIRSSRPRFDQCLLLGEKKSVGLDQIIFSTFLHSGPGPFADNLGADSIFQLDCLEGLEHNLSVSI